MPILPKGKKSPGKRPMLNMYWMYLLIILSLVILYNFQDNTSVKDVNVEDFLNQTKNGYVDNIKINREDAQVIGILNESGLKNNNMEGPNGKTSAGEIKTQAGSAESFEKKLDEINKNRETNGETAIPYEFINGSDLMKIFWYFGPILLFVALMILLSRRMGGPGGQGGIFNVGKSRAKVFDKNNGSNVTFKDVAGLAEAKVEIEEIVEFLKNPDRYTELGAKIPRGALLVGPPGTGKTLLAKAVAGEANVPFLSMSGSDFVEMFVGVGAARVRDLFKQAKEKAPCIVFIDEIDAVGRARGKNPNMGSNDERENTLNQMLTEMDGFGSNNGVIILAATNRVDMLDKALLRPGRFDRQIMVDLPELTDRVEILNVHLRNIKVNADLDIEQIARQTSGFSGADLANVCNEAALIAARNNKADVDMNDFRQAIDRIIGGLEKKSVVYTQAERTAIATHEAGHATVSWLLKYGSPLVKVTIVPRGRAGGYAMYAPEDRKYTPLQSLLDQICGLTAGRAAEEMFLGEVGTGGFDDLEKATKLALSIVMYYGGSPRLRNLNYYDSTGQAYGYARPYSDATASIIDEEVKRIVNEQYERAKEILKKYGKEHNEIRDMLLAREVIYHDDVQAVLGPRPWKSRDEDPLVKAHYKKLAEKRSSFVEDAEFTETSDNQQHSAPDDSNTSEQVSESENRDTTKDVITPGSEDDDAGTPPPFNK